MFKKKDWKRGCKVLSWNSKPRKEEYWDKVPLDFKLLTPSQSGLSKEIVKEILSKKPKNVLDIGCGDGSLLSQLYGCLRLGLDFSYEMLRLGKANNAQRDIEYIQALAESLPFKDRAFDALIAINLVQEFPSYKFKDIGKEWYRILKEGGKLISNIIRSEIYCKELRTPRFDKKNLIFYAVENINGKYIVKPEQTYFLIDFIKLLKECGFNKFRYKPITFPIRTLYKKQGPPPSGWDIKIRDIKRMEKKYGGFPEQYLITAYK